jgi:type IV fimbrial biogenesis protein FimT
MPTHAPRQAGATLIEILTVVAIAAVLAASAGVALRDVGRSARLSGHTYRLLSELNLARSEAIKRNARVVLCKSADGESCASGGGWEQGWIVFHDANNNAARESGETIIRRSEGGLARFRIVGNETVARYVSFAPFGGARLTSGAFQAGTITLCQQSAGPAEGRQLVINAVGRPRIHKLTLASCS